MEQGCPSPGGTFRLYLCIACRSARQAGGESQAGVARLAGMSRSAIHRFEEAGAWPRDPERMIRAYAAAGKLNDSRLLWRKALDLWIQEGTDTPPLPGTTPVEPLPPPGLEPAIDELVRVHLRGSDERGEGNPGHQGIRAA
jgi:hypothetical protein